MEAKIIALGPEKVSHHAADLTKLERVRRRAELDFGSRQEDAAWEARHQGEQVDCAKFIVPPLDPGYHFEIKQPKS